MKQQGAGLDRVMAGAMLVVWSGVLVWLRWDAWAPDLSAVVIAAALWAEGARDLVYAAPTGFFGGAPEAWGPMMEHLGVGGQESFAYVYPPLWVALLAPLTQAVSVQAVLNAVALVQMPLLAGSVALAGRLAKPQHWSWSRWVVWGLAVLSLTAPAAHAVLHNQPTITVGFLILLTAERLASGRPLTAGAVLALAAAIKLTPAVFLLLFLLPPSRRGLAAFLATGLALAAASLALAGWEAHLQFLQALGTLSGVSLMIAINLSLQTALVTLGAVAGLWPLPLPLPVPAAIAAPLAATLLARVGGLALLGALVWRWRGRAQAPLALLIGLAVLVPLAGPLGWLHYYLVPLLLLPGLLVLLPAGLARGLIGAVLAVSALPLFLALRGLPGFDLWFVLGGALIWLAVVVALLRRRV